MLHLVARACPGTLLFHDWCEARDLWLRLVALGTPEALVLMPDHVHLVTSGIETPAWWGALSGFARWLNHHRGRAGGRVWAPAPPARDLPDARHGERTVRYVVLNPCRGALVNDPLAWPFSTHRDALGLALPPVRRTARDPARLHRYVSSDPSVAVGGTPLPTGEGHRGPEAVLAAVSALSRLPVSRLGAEGPIRDVAIRYLRDRCGLSARAVARWLPVSHATASRVPVVVPATLAVVDRVLGDPRFAALEEGDLRRLPAWRRFLAHRHAAPHC